MSIAEKLTIIAKNEPKIYDKGIADRDELIWKMVTDNGARANYHNAFQYTDLSGYKFAKPIKPTGYVSQMFYACYNMTALPENIDFSEILSTGGDATSTYRRGVFGYSRVLTTIPDLNMRAIGGLEEWFQYCFALQTIELLRVHRDTIYTNTFTRCDKLTEIRFDGEIGQNISFPDSTLLSVESQVNIIKHLVQNPAAQGSNRRILSIHPTAWERLNQTYTTPEEVGIPFSGSWLSYLNSIGWDM